MKTLRVILVLAAMAGNLCAQSIGAGMGAPEMRAQVARNAFLQHPYRTREDLTASRFWTPSTIALVALDGAAKAADSFATRENIAGGGEEYNPLVRPFVHTTAVQVSATAVLFGAEVAAAYLLHRRRHDSLGRAV
ncbi:MAG: hypothetical protein WBP70_15820, partial [Terriglobales bacterium]